MINPLPTLSTLTLGLAACTSFADKAHSLPVNHQKPNIKKVCIPRPTEMHDLLAQMPEKVPGMK